MPRSQVSIPCAAVLFDLDGVLVDSSAVVERSWRRWARHHRIEEAVLMGLIHGRTALDTVRLAAPRLDPRSELAALIRQELEDEEGPKSVAGVAALLGALPAARWAIVTSAPRVIAVDRLDRLRLRRPEVLICAEDVTEGKPRTYFVSDQK